MEVTNKNRIFSLCEKTLSLENEKKNSFSFCILLVYSYLCNEIEKINMLVLQDCIQKLSNFKMMFAQKYGITKLGIFGSVARNEHSEQSDIDIVVEVEKPSLRLMYELKEALKQLFNCEVDLVRFRDSLRPLFKSNIQRDVIYV